VQDLSAGDQGWTVQQRGADGIWGKEEVRTSPVREGGVVQELSAGEQGWTAQQRGEGRRVDGLLYSVQFL